MVTNGLIFNPDLVDAFNRFIEYRIGVTEKWLRKSNMPEELIEETITYYKNSSILAIIDFSHSKYHPGVSPEIRKKYLAASKGITIINHDLSRFKVKKTGNATFGTEYKYGVDPLLLDYDEENDLLTFTSNELVPFLIEQHPEEKYLRELDPRRVFSSIYITAKGDFTTEGFGTFTDIDNHNFGKILDIEKLLKDGKAFFVESKSRKMIKEAQKWASTKPKDLIQIPVVKRNALSQIYREECKPIYNEITISRILQGLNDNEPEELDFSVDFQTLPKELYNFLFNEAPKGFDDLIYSNTEAITYRPDRAIFYPAHEPIEKRKQKVLKYNPVYNKEDFK